MKSEKLLPFWNAVSVAGFTVLAGVLTGYVALQIVSKLP